VSLISFTDSGQKPTRLWPGEEKIETRDVFLKGQRLQTTIFEIASQVTGKLAPETRPFVFPQVIENLTQRWKVASTLDAVQARGDEK
jgi:hypothetical protein